MEICRKSDKCAEGIREGKWNYDSGDGGYTLIYDAQYYNNRDEQYTEMWFQGNYIKMYEYERWDEFIEKN